MIMSWTLLRTASPPLMRPVGPSHVSILTIIQCFGDVVATKLWLTYYRCWPTRRYARNVAAAICVKRNARAGGLLMFNFADTGGLFDHFEVNREPFWPKMSWLVAGSGVWHLVLVSLIVLIPPVRDAFSITAMFRE